MFWIRKRTLFSVGEWIGSMVTPAELPTKARYVRFLCWIEYKYIAPNGAIVTVTSPLETAVEKATVVVAAIAGGFACYHFWNI